MKKIKKIIVETVKFSVAMGTGFFTSRKLIKHGCDEAVSVAVGAGVSVAASKALDVANSFIIDKVKEFAVNGQPECSGNCEDCEDPCTFSEDFPVEETADDEVAEEPAEDANSEYTSEFNDADDEVMTEEPGEEKSHEETTEEPVEEAYDVMDKKIAAKENESYGYGEE